MFCLNFGAPAIDSHVFPVASVPLGLRVTENGHALNFDVCCSFSVDEQLEAAANGTEHEVVSKVGVVLNLRRVKFDWVGSAVGDLSMKDT